MNNKHDKQTDDKPQQTAVALQYDGFNAPRVTATGQGASAERIMDIARQHDVPLQQNPGLALALSSIPLNDEIPAELYLVVAEILAFIYFLDEVEHDYAPIDTTHDYS